MGKKPNRRRDVQSISWTLKEAVKTDGLSTTVDSWFDYPIIKFSEIPSLNTILIERPSEKPLGLLRFLKNQQGQLFLMQ